MIRGSVDAVSTTEVLGWAYGPGRNDPILVQAVLNHEILGEALANQYRPDLAAAGLGDGHSGYLIKLYRPVDPLYLPFIRIRLDGGDAELPRAPHLGFADFFSNLYEKHPFAGRPRSVFGGLWTDRTDASALLRGKASTGLIAPALAPILQSLIYEGFALIPLGYPLSGPAGALSDPALAPLLLAILEDFPLLLQTTTAAGTSPLAQPSAANPSPSPAECLALLLPPPEGAAFDIIRHSHSFPEFSPAGASRWTGQSHPQAAEGFLDRHELPASTAALISPGAIYRTIAPDSPITTLTLIPARTTPAGSALSPDQPATPRKRGARAIA
jgi:hypothetical protein